jgi:hypothetical protein
MEDGAASKTDYSEFYGKLLMYSTMESRDYLIDPQDKIWFDKSKNGRCKYLNNAKAYVMQKKLLRKKGHKIVTSFLILQKYYYDESEELS